jgi:serine/threonine-protein kinase ULK2
MKKIGPYTLEKVIGKGHYSSVYRGCHEETNKIVAVKALTRKNISASQLKNIENEIVVLDRVDHLNVIKMIDKMRSTNFYYIVLEFCNGGDLQSYI